MGKIIQTIEKRINTLQEKEISLRKKRFVQQMFNPEMVRYTAIEIGNTVVHISNLRQLIHNYSIKPQLK